MSQNLSDRDRVILFGEDDLVPGEAVVHFEHGLARYEGETSVEIEGVAQRLVTLVYRHGGKLMLPVEELSEIWRYGAPAEDVTLDRLKAGDWTARRDAMIEELRHGADHVLDADRRRRARSAPALQPDADAMEAISEGFPHVPTDDQARAIEATLADLRRTLPMNRLLIGDVGFGKTEIAVRAAAAAVLAGHQVAVAVPTTVLARQHAEAFRDRLAPHGADVVELSRLTDGAERADALDRLARGEARVAVGTSALLSEEVAFDDLALVIVDEEQKFGTAQKAALRRLSEGCHVLSMTATPIPRSLALAEVGLLDLSVLAEPPGARKGVETEIAAPSDDRLRDAVAAEVARGGQAFVVCPRIAALEAVEATLTSAGDLSVAIVHGELPEEDLEERMLGFARGEIDVLLSTALIENGLDVPRANAMVVLDPEMFGLSQLHQLRGRIGRGSERAHLLLLTEVDMRDPEDEAAARLAAFAEASGPGDGFRIARRDRDLRGFGEIDGEDQSGHASRLGIGLYRHVLRERLSGAALQDAAA